MPSRLDPNRFLPLTHLEYHLLAVLLDGPQHGYSLVQLIRERSGGFVDPGTGSFYSIIRKLSEEGLISETENPSGSRQRRSYAISHVGRRVLAAETHRLEAQIAAAFRRLDLATKPRGHRA